MASGNFTTKPMMLVDDMLKHMYTYASTAGFFITFEKKYTHHYYLLLTLPLLKDFIIITINETRFVLRVLIVAYREVIPDSIYSNQQYLVNLIFESYLQYPVSWTRARVRFEDYRHASRLSFLLPPRNLSGACFPNLC